jgi:AraC family transcriptional regulator of arabinose operon
VVDPQLRLTAPRSILSGYFQQGHGYRSRRHHGTNDWLLMATEDGAGFLATGSSRIRVERGHLSCYLPGTPQDYGTELDPGHWDFVWAHVDPRTAWAGWLNWHEVSPGMRHLVIDDEELFTAILTSLHACHRDACGALPQHEELARNALERALLLADLANPAAATGRLDPRVRQAVAYIGAHLDRSVSLAGIAAACDSSPSRLAHLFRDQIGMAPIRFHEHQRLQRAAQLLAATAESIQDIATTLGFDDPFYFSNRFRRRYACSPSAYRKRSGAAAEQ